MREPFDLFISYDRDDEPLREELDNHLAPLEREGAIRPWHKRKIGAGEEWRGHVDDQLEAADLILLLVSPSFLASDYCFDVEATRALERHAMGRARVIRVIVRPCDSTRSPFAELQVLPKNGEPITCWENRDQGWLDIVQALRASITKLRRARGAELEMRDEWQPRYPDNESRQLSRRLGASPDLGLARPGAWRWFLDRLLPRIHSGLTTWGTLSRPPELKALRGYLERRAGELEQDLYDRTYLPLSAKDLDLGPLAGRSKVDGPIPQVIRKVLDVAQGGDAASPQIAAIHKASKRVRNVVRVVLAARLPLVLLGDPGTGKTMTLQQVALALARSEKQRVFPKVTLLVRLGEFFSDTRQVGPEEVKAYVRRSAPAALQPYLEALGDAERLVILFDGMDEMSRERYAEHTRALSSFAATHKQIRTLFSCRITDFSSEFIHRKLVLLPFAEAQIHNFLQTYAPGGFPLKIDGHKWSSRQLAKELARGDLAMEPSNPFVLWLLVIYLWEQRKWPAHRVELLRFYNEDNYRRKEDEDPADLPSRDMAFSAWGELAYRITERNRGPAIPVAILEDSWRHSLAILEAIRTGERCGVLTVVSDQDEALVRFEHHRFQEFFTALHIHEARPPIRWLDKLDAPRWQETMLNAVLIGETPEAITELQRSITEPVARYEAELKAAEVASEDKAEEVRWRRENYEEVELADRVELAARIVRKAGVALAETGRQLADTALRGVRLLIEHGNPISQVMMIQACHNLPDIDREKELAKPLESPIRWVRRQALPVLAADPGSTSLINTLAYDLAGHRVLPHLGAYLAAARKAQRSDQIAFSILAGFCHLLVLVFPLALALFAFVPLVGPELATEIGGWMPWLAGFLTAGALFVFWGERTLVLLLISLYGPVVVTLLMAFLLQLLGGPPGDLEDLGENAFAAVVFGPLFYLHLVAVVLLWHGLCLALFLGVAEVCGRPITKRWLAFRTLWEQSYREILNEKSAPNLLKYPLGLLGVLGILALLAWLIDWFEVQENSERVEDAWHQGVQIIENHPREWIPILAAILALLAVLNQQSIVRWVVERYQSARSWVVDNPGICWLVMWIAIPVLFIALDEASRVAALSLLAVVAALALWKRREVKDWSHDQPIARVVVGGLLFLYALRVSILVAGVAVAGLVVWGWQCRERLRRWGQGFRGELANNAQSIMGCLGLMFVGSLFIGLLRALNAWISPWAELKLIEIETSWKKLWSGIEEPLIAVGLKLLFIVMILVLGVALISTLLYLVRRLARRVMASSLVPKTVIPPNRLTGEGWMARIRAHARDPERQHLDLLRVDEESLGFTKQRFLRALEELEEHIHGEPALSTYWHRRSNMQNSLRQEREG